ncbi:MAG TPA: hypothetical protein VHP38_00165 [Ruminiclostridium sp.]|nr:hypothetical protein [Ruminiclostridium sp.]
MSSNSSKPGTAASAAGSGFFNLTAEEYTILALALAFLLAENLDNRSRLILGEFLVVTGENLIHLTPDGWNAIGATTI